METVIESKTRELSSGTTVETRSMSGPNLLVDAKAFEPCEERDSWVCVDVHVRGSGGGVDAVRLDAKRRNVVAITVDHATLYVSMADAAALLDVLRLVDGIDDEAKLAAAGDALDAREF